MTAVFGIVNLAPDSFSDGGEFVDLDVALNHTRNLWNAGAYAIDVGPSSSNPDSVIVSAQTEIARFQPLLKPLHEERIRISVDSFQPEVQLFAAENNVAFLNDVHGFSYPEIYPQLAKSECGLIVLHSVHGTGKTDKLQVKPDEILNKIETFFEQRIDALLTAGIARDRIIIDPGMGWFLSDIPETSLITLRAISWLKKRFELPVMIGTSRKSFVRRVSGRSAVEAGYATLATELFAIHQGVDYIRTHDVAATVDGWKIWNSLEQTSA